jgi:hypothetical protein
MEAVRPRTETGSHFEAQLNRKRILLHLVNDSRQTPAAEQRDNLAQRSGAGYSEKTCTDPRGMKEDLSCGKQV